MFVICAPANTRVIQYLGPPLICAHSLTLSEQKSESCVRPERLVFSSPDSYSLNQQKFTCIGYQKSLIQKYHLIKLYWAHHIRIVKLTCIQGTRIQSWVPSCKLAKKKKITNSYTYRMKSLYTIIRKLMKFSFNSIIFSSKYFRQS